MEEEGQRRDIGGEADRKRLSGRDRGEWKKN
jgi:hypothetical protein